MSVKRTVASTRSSSASSARTPARKRSTSRTTASWSPPTGSDPTGYLGEARGSDVRRDVAAPLLLPRIVSPVKRRASAPGSTARMSAHVGLGGSACVRKHPPGVTTHARIGCTKRALLVGGEGRVLRPRPVTVEAPARPLQPTPRCPHPSSPHGISSDFLHVGNSLIEDERRRVGPGRRPRRGCDEAAIAGGEDGRALRPGLVQHGADRSSTSVSIGGMSDRREPLGAPEPSPVGDDQPREPRELAQRSGRRPGAPS